MADTTEEFQKHTRELLRAQQETYVAAVKKWRESLAASGGDHVQPPPWPQPMPVQMMPTPTEVAEAYYAFAAKLLAEEERKQKEREARGGAAPATTTDPRRPRPATPDVVEIEGVRRPDAPGTAAERGRGW